MTASMRWFGLAAIVAVGNLFPAVVRAAETEEPTPSLRRIRIVEPQRCNCDTAQICDAVSQCARPAPKAPAGQSRTQQALDDLREEVGKVRGDVETVRRNLEEHLAALPPSAPATSPVQVEKGNPSEPGHTPTAAELTALIRPLIPRPVPGLPGQNGRAGRDGADFLRESMSFGGGVTFSRRLVGPFAVGQLNFRLAGNFGLRTGAELGYSFVPPARKGWGDNWHSGVWGGLEWRKTVTLGLELRYAHRMTFYTVREAGFRVAGTTPPIEWLGGASLQPSLSVLQSALSGYGPLALEWKFVVGLTVLWGGAEAKVAERPLEPLSIAVEPRAVPQPPSPPPATPPAPPPPPAALPPRVEPPPVAAPAAPAAPPAPEAAHPESPPEAPPPDRDEDGIPDAEDRCPTVKGVAEFHGCPPPPPPDRDEDGIPDADDACPDQPGLPQYKGCPPPESAPVAASPAPAPAAPAAIPAAPAPLASAPPPPAPTIPAMAPPAPPPTVARVAPEDAAAAVKAAQTAVAANWRNPDPRGSAVTTGAAAPDTEPPIISISKVARVGGAVAFEIAVVDNTAVKSCFLYWRPKGDTREYGRETPIPSGGDCSYNVAGVQASAIEFYFEARDAAGNIGRLGTADQPEVENIGPPPEQKK